MTTLLIRDELAEKLKDISAQEQRSVDDVLRSMLEIYETIPQSSTISSEDALDAMCGMFDDDVTDLSSIVRETMEAYYRDKYGRPD